MALCHRFIADLCVSNEAHRPPTGRVLVAVALGKNPALVSEPFLCFTRIRYGTTPTKHRRPNLATRPGHT